MFLNGINYFPNNIIDELSEYGGGNDRINQKVDSIFLEINETDKKIKNKIRESLKAYPSIHGFPITIQNKDYTECIQSTVDNNLIQRHVYSKNGTLLAETKKSNFKGYNNYYEYNEQGKKTNFIEYNDFGSYQSQKMHFQSDNGSFDKEIIVSGNKKTMKTTIKNNKGKTTTILRTYENNQNGTAISTINGKKYEISGLNGNEIKIKTPEGKELKLNLEKLVDGNTENEKTKLKEYIKLLPGDVLENLSKEVKTVKFLNLENKDGGYDALNEGLLLTGYNDNETTLHELAHALDAYQGGQHSSSNTFKTTFNKERSNMHKYAIGEEINHSEYLLKDKEQTDSVANQRKGPYRSNREMFADCFALMNDMEIGKIAARQLLIMRAFHGTMQNINEATQIDNLNSKERQY